MVLLRTADGVCFDRDVFTWSTILVDLRCVLVDFFLVLMSSSRDLPNLFSTAVVILEQKPRPTCWPRTFIVGAGCGGVVALTSRG